MELYGYDHNITEVIMLLFADDYITNTPSCGKEAAWISGKIVGGEKKLLLNKMRAVAREYWNDERVSVCARWK